MASDTNDTLKPGAILRGKYRIKRVLGEGGMGRVVRATHLKLDQDVAIKMLKPESAKNERVVARFAREARAAARLKSEHVVRILDVDEHEDNAPFIVMEYLDGTDLDRLVRKRGPVSSTRAVELALEACEGLAEAHSLGIVHRDVKPANLFLATNQRGLERVKLLDFGISKAPETGQDPTITEADRLLGSPSFMSPEQLKAARDVDARTDVWSLGVVLYFLVSGRLPFEGDSATSVAARIAADQPRALDDLKEPLPAELIAVVMRCLEKDPDARYGSVAELAHDLAPFAPEGKVAASRVSSALRMPAAAPSAAASGPMASARALTTADRTASASNQRVTASLSELVAEPQQQQQHEEPEQDRNVTQSVDAGSVSSTADRPPEKEGDSSRERTTAASERKKRSPSTWIAMLAVAAVAVVIVVWLAKSGPKTTTPPPTAGVSSPPAATSTVVPVPEPSLGVPSSAVTGTASSSAPSSSAAQKPVFPSTTTTQAVPPPVIVRPSASASSKAVPSADPLKLDLK